MEENKKRKKKQKKKIIMITERKKMEKKRKSKKEKKTEIDIKNNITIADFCKLTIHDVLRITIQITILLDR